MGSTCFMCGLEIRRQLGFNPAGLNTLNCQILKELRRSWSTSFCSLLDVKDGQLRQLLQNVPYCITCHEVISDVEFMISTVSRLKSRLRHVKTEVKTLLSKSYNDPDSEYRQLIHQVLVSTEAQVVNGVTGKDKRSDAESPSRVSKGSEGRHGITVNIKQENQHIPLKNETNDDNFGAADADDPNWSPSEEFDCKPKKVVKVSKPKAKSRSQLRSVKQEVYEGGIRIGTGRRKSFKCTTCNQVVVTLTAFKRHLKRSHPTETVKFPCTICGKEYLTEEEAQAHQVLHDQSVNPYTCIICSAEFLCTSDLRKHVNIDHDGHSRPQFLCDLCPLVYLCSENLRKHKIKKHFVGGSKLIQCPQCPFMALFPSELKYHALTHGEKQFHCDFENCSSKFHLNKSLRNHKKKVHGVGAKRFTCPVCRKVFNDLQHMKLHELHHSTLRPYICDKCSATFKTGRNLRSHLKVHADDKPNRTIIKLQRPRKARLIELRVDRKLLME